MKAVRSASSIIWRTVVCGGAMLGGAACGGAAPSPKPTEAVAVEAPIDPMPDPENADPAPEPDPAPFQFDATSKPAGALVYLGEQALGSTPLTFSLEHAAETQTLRFEKSGYVTTTVELTPEGAVTIHTPAAAEGYPASTRHLAVASDGHYSLELALNQVAKPVRARGSGEGGAGRGFVLS